MFVQVIKGHTGDAAGLRQQLERWRTDLKPTAVGFVGSTGGIDDDGTFVVVARFTDAESAREELGAARAGPVVGAHRDLPRR